jgi:hypothetical protein
MLASDFATLGSSFLIYTIIFLILVLLQELGNLGSVVREIWFLAQLFPKGLEFRGGHRTKRFTIENGTKAMILLLGPAIMDRVGTRMQGLASNVETHQTDNHIND